MRKVCGPEPLLKGAGADRERVEMAEATIGKPEIDEGKRRFLIGATSVVGGIGAVAAATPFVMSFFPSERAKAAGAPVELDIAKIEPGQQIDVEWRGKVVWIINRTQADARNAAQARRSGRGSEFRS